MNNFKLKNVSHLVIRLKKEETFIEIFLTHFERYQIYNPALKFSSNVSKTVLIHFTA